MLNRSKLLKELDRFSGEIFADNSEEFRLARQLWDEICQDENFANKIKDIQTPYLIPAWSGKLNNLNSINQINNYTIVSCDGSQIYPDRHQGTSCFLINIGTVKFEYCQNSKVSFDSYPFLFSQDDEAAIEIVDCKRQEYEFQFGFDLMNAHAKSSSNNPFIFLFDGSLIFWHLESKSPALSQQYIGRYLGLLHEFYKQKLFIVGYISLPKSKELVNLLRAHIHLTNKDIKIDNLLDLHIAGFFLDKFNRSILFKNYSSITDSYPAHLHPYFFYLNTGNEIARIEVPAWIAANNENIELISSIILDQCHKGYGYPISLAEAHEQAVVKSFDRDFFYDTLNKLNIKKNHQIYMSRKSLKKKFMGF